MNEEVNDMSKQDQRNSENKSNNALSVGKMIENTKKNIQEAEISMDLVSSPEELENLEEKNERRKHSIDKMKKQLRDERAFEARKDSFK